MRTKTKTSKKPRASELRLFGERLAAYRHKRGLTQADVAKSLHISVAYVSLLERGARNPPYTTVVKLAHALDVTVARLIPA